MVKNKNKKYVKTGKEYINLCRGNKDGLSDMSIFRQIVPLFDDDDSPHGIWTLGLN